MAILEQINAMLPAIPFLDDPPPSHVFELSAAGIAFAVRPQGRGQAPEIRFEPFGGEVLAVSPVNDNVVNPEALAAHVASLVKANGKRRGAAVILPDYCARVAILDFEAFPGGKDEQLSLVRFRMKKTVPFDLETASVSYHAQKAAGRNTEVVVAAAAREIIARYEAPFRAAGYQPGYLTTATLAAVDLLPAEGLVLLAKLSGQILTVALCEGRNPKLVRCVELAGLDLDEVMAVLYPTVAFAEDTLNRRPDRLAVCGFGDNAPLREACVGELGLEVEQLRSAWGAAQDYNAGLLGWLAAQEDK
jgi:type IV pilus assembly protein PilM